MSVHTYASRKSRNQIQEKPTLVGFVQVVQQIIRQLSKNGIEGRGAY